MAKIFIVESDINILNIMAVKGFGLKAVVILKDRNVKNDYGLQALGFYLKKMNCFVTYENFDPYRTEELINLSKRVDLEDVFIVPTNSSAYIFNLALLLKDVCRVAYVESDSDFFELVDGLFIPMNTDAFDLNIDDYIEQYGGKVLNSNTEVFDNPVADKLLEIILSNAALYDNLLTPVPIYTDVANKHLVHLKREMINPAEGRLLDTLLDVMIQNGICAYHNKMNKESVEFYNLDFKEFISKDGTWLEMVTYKAIKSLTKVSDVGASVSFQWRMNRWLTKNEVDVMAVHDHKLIMVSCKNTHSHNEQSLYELYTHSERLDENQAIKILVTTGQPIEAFYQRAQDLKIHIVIFNGNMDKFEKLLGAIIG